MRTMDACSKCIGPNRLDHLAGSTEKQKNKTSKSTIQWTLNLNHIHAKQCSFVFMLGMFPTCAYGAIGTSR